MKFNEKYCIDNTVLTIRYCQYDIGHIIWSTCYVMTPLVMTSLNETKLILHIDTNFGIKYNDGKYSALTLIRLHHNCISSRIFSFLHILLYDSSL